MHLDPHNMLSLSPPQPNNTLSQISLIPNLMIKFTLNLIPQEGPHAIIAVVALIILQANYLVVSRVPVASLVAQ